MSDKRNHDPQSGPEDPSGEEEIIDLVEELPLEEDSRAPLSDLERKLLDLDAPAPGAGGNPVDLPDLADLSSFDFEEELDELSAAAEADNRPNLHGSQIEEISEFDEQLLDTKDILDVEEILSETLPSEKRDAAPETDDDLELIDVEEDEADDEIIWFDDLDKEALEPEPSTTDAAPEATDFDGGADAGVHPSAVDLFTANVESALPEPDPGPALALAGAAAAAAAVPPPPKPAPLVFPPAAENAGPAAVSSLSPAELEAAVERVLERKLGSAIESTIRQAIENAVSKEIERLKRLLIEDDDRGPAA
jgi:hypothetical protein